MKRIIAGVILLVVIVLFPQDVDANKYKPPKHTPTMTATPTRLPYITPTPGW